MTLNSANITPLYSDSLTAILFVVFIITIVILVALVFWVVLYIKGSKRRALINEGKVRGTSRLFAELEKLNNGPYSLKRVWFCYKNTGYKRIETYDEWMAYDAADYIREHLADLADDLNRLQRFNDRCSKYNACVRDLWARYKASPSAIRASGLQSRVYCSVEERICNKAIIRRTKHKLRYGVAVECVSQRTTKYIYFGKDEIQAVMLANLENEKRPTASQTVQKAPIKEPEPSLKPNVTNNNRQTDFSEPDSIQNKPLMDVKTSANGSAAVDRTKTNTDSQVGARAFSEAFERFFGSIDNLEKQGYFWSRLSEEERDSVKQITKMVFDTSMDYLPSHQPNIFGFRLRMAKNSTQRSTFWIRRNNGVLCFTYPVSKDSIELRDIPITGSCMPKLQETISQLILADRKNDSVSAERPFTCSKKGEGVTGEEPPLVKALSTSSSSFDDDRKILKLLALDNKSLFYGKQNHDNQQLIESIILFACKKWDKIIPCNEPFSLGFGRKDDLESGYRWFGFRERMGEGLTFFYKENRLSGTPNTVAANQYQKTYIESILNRIIESEISRPVSTQAPKTIDKPKKEHEEASNSSNEWGGPNCFFNSCNSDEKLVIKNITAFARSIDAALEIDNSSTCFGFKLNGQDSAIQYCFWFRKVDDGELCFSYWNKNDVLNIRAINKSDSVVRMQTAVEKVLRNLQDEAEKIKNALSLDDDLIEIQKTNYFFSRLANSEKTIVLETIEYVKKQWPRLRVENCKNFLGFKMATDSVSTPFWFWFQRTENNAFEFTFKDSPFSKSQNTMNARTAGFDAVAKALMAFMPSDSELDAFISERRCADEATKNREAFWSRPYLYLSEIAKQEKLGNSQKNPRIRKLCNYYGYTLDEGVAYGRKYQSFAEAIYLSEIIAPACKIYVYSNPYNCTTYDRALQKLLDELKIFDLGEGRYLTIVGLEETYGISRSDCSECRARVQRYLDNHDFFSFDNLREVCSDNKLLELYPDEKIMSQLVHSVMGRSAKIILTDQDYPKSVYATGFRDIQLKKFFYYILGDDEAADIYTIKDRVEIAFGVNYNLDIIGRDAEKGGLFYSEDMEKVYKDKSYFYKEIQQ